MKKLMTIVFILAILLMAMGGAVMAQPSFGTVAFGGSASTICSAPVTIPITVAEVTDLEEFYISIIYDPSVVSAVMVGEDSFFGPTVSVPLCNMEAGNGEKACVYAASGGPVSTVAPEPLANLTLTSMGSVGGSQVYFLAQRRDLPPPGNSPNDIGRTTLNDIPPPAITLGAPLDIPPCPLAIGDPLAFGAGAAGTSAASPLFAVGGLLGLSGLALAYNYRKE